MPLFNRKWQMPRQGLWCFLGVIVFLALSPVTAQDSSRNLAPGSILSDVLGPNATATSYIFDAAVGTSASITVSSASGNALALLLSDANGNVVGRAVDESASGRVEIASAQLLSGGRYFVVVYFAPGSSATDTVYDINLVLTEAAADDAGGRANS